MIATRELDPSGVLAAAGSALAAIKERDGEILQLAAHWADLHHPDSLPPPTDAREQRQRRFDGDCGLTVGGGGTPRVLSSCLAELGVMLETNAVGAKHLVADALDLRHRLPRLWAEAVSGRVRAWRARQVAAATRHLPLEVMADIDADLVGLLPVLPWARFATVLEATVMRADPGPSRASEEEAASRRFVGLGRTNDCGITTLIARGTALDIQTFMAAVRRIADILGRDGDPDPVDVRRSKAVGILGQPARALALLTAHRDDPDEDGPPDHPGADQGAPAEAGNQDGPKDSQPEPDDFQPEPDDPEPEPDDFGRRALDLRPFAGLDPADLARIGGGGPRVQLYVHLTEGALRGLDPRAVARVEGVGPITVSTVRSWLRRPDVSVTIRPVVVPGEAVPVDAYEIRRLMREAVRLRSPASSFPWSSCTSTRMDLDHTEPYRRPDHGGPPGQTRPDNLAPLARPEHAGKTSGRWQVRSPAPGVHLWRTPHGWIHLVTNQGTFPLGRTPAASAMWCAVGLGGEGAEDQRDVRLLGSPPAPRTPSVLEGYLRDLLVRSPTGSA